LPSNAALETPRRIDHERRQARPITAMLKRLDLGEVERPEQATRRRRQSKPIPNTLIDDAIIFSRALPAHPADQTDHSHQTTPVR
jgi:hypothetical protein